LRCHFTPFTAWPMGLACVTGGPTLLRAESTRTTMTACGNISADTLCLQPASPYDCLIEGPHQHPKVVLFRLPRSPRSPCLSTIALADAEEMQPSMRERSKRVFRLRGMGMEGQGAVPDLLFFPTTYILQTDIRRQYNASQKEN
jgi:hypothetical protein